MLRLLTLAFACLFGLSCSGGATQIKIGPPPEKLSRGPLAGPLCESTQCKCRKGAEEAGFPDDGRKRFEIKLLSAQQLWVTLPGHLLYKDPERAEACFYVDFAPGAHGVELRASNPNGVSAAIEIHELGTTTKSWYDTFAFACGHPGVCSFEDLDAAKASYREVKRNLHDACGSTKIKSVNWDHGKAPDGLHPSELLVRLTLDVYKFPPTKKHGDPTCGPGDGSSRDDAPAEEPAAAPAPAP